jgi:acetyltransferase-like isoleucine patch superfamily enzyme
MIVGGSSIKIGSRSTIREFARLEVIYRTDKSWYPSLQIGNRVNIEQGVHIVCHGEVIIEDEVSIAPYCGIFDVSHPNDPPDRGDKIGNRLSEKYQRVRIGAGSLIGMHVVILPNVQIGKGCVIGAGSVVRCDIPDYCVAVGAPARIVRRFNLESRTWEQMNV